MLFRSNVFLSRGTAIGTDVMEGEFQVFSGGKTTGTALVGSGYETLEDGSANGIVISGVGILQVFEGRL